AARVADRDEASREQRKRAIEREFSSRKCWRHVIPLWAKRARCARSKAIADAPAVKRPEMPLMRTAASRALQVWKMIYAERKVARSELRALFQCVELFARVAAERRVGIFLDDAVEGLLGVGALPGFEIRP